MTPDWSALAADHAPALVARLRTEYEGGSISFTATELAQAASTLARTFGVDEALALLEAAGSWLTKGERSLPTDPDFPDEPAAAIPVFTWTGAQRRSLGWLLLVHGMNTSGEWQQDFAFDVGRWRGTAVPTFVHKYGWVVVGVVLPWRRRKLREELRARIIGLTQRAEEQRLPARPDVVAHSFGTWLLGHLLLDEMRKGEPHAVKLGRVILTGSVLRPDFPWHELQAKGLVEDVLNHYATNDPIVPLAQWTIWQSGPSGARGFDSSNSPHSAHDVLNVKAAPEGHSGALSERARLGNYSEVWRPFLSNPVGQASSGLGRDDPGRVWRQAWWLLRGTLFPLLAVPLLVGLLAWGLLELGPGLTWLRDLLGGGLHTALQGLGVAAAGLLGLYFVQRSWRWIAGDGGSIP